MKTNEILTMLIAAAAVLGIGVMLTRKAGATTSTGPGLGVSGTPDQSWNSEIPNTALPGQPGWGWKYYTNGTSIDPQGRYYFQGTLISSGGAIY